MMVILIYDKKIIWLLKLKPLCILKLSLSLLLLDFDIYSFTRAIKINILIEITKYLTYIG